MDGGGDAAAAVATTKGGVQTGKALGNKGEPSRRGDAARLGTAVMAVTTLMAMCCGIDTVCGGRGITSSFVVVTNEIF